MRPIQTILRLFATAIVSLAQENVSHKNELAFGLGGMPSFSRSSSPRLDIGSGVALQVNYARRILGGQKFALYGEIHFLASPQREVSSTSASATHDVASLYITPGVRLKFLPTSRVSPYFAVGGGYAEYEQSTTELDGHPNAASRELSRGAFDFGAGADIRVWRWVALRGEARDFYTGSPAYNLASISGGQHNVVAGGAVVFQWH